MAVKGDGSQGWEGWRKEGRSWVGSYALFCLLLEESKKCLLAFTLRQCLWAFIFAISSFQILLFSLTYSYANPTVPSPFLRSQLKCHLSLESTLYLQGHHSPTILPYKVCLCPWHRREQGSVSCGPRDNLASFFLFPPLPLLPQTEFLCPGCLGIHFVD